MHLSFQFFAGLFKSLSSYRIIELTDQFIFSWKFAFHSFETTDVLRLTSSMFFSCELFFKQLNSVFQLLFSCNIGLPMDQSLNFTSKLIEIHRLIAKHFTQIFELIRVYNIGLFLQLKILRILILNLMLRLRMSICDDVMYGLAAIWGRDVSGGFGEGDAGGEKFLIVGRCYLANGSFAARGCSCSNIVRTHFFIMHRRLKP